MTAKGQLQMGLTPHFAVGPKDKGGVQQLLRLEQLPQPPTAVTPDKGDVIGSS